MMYKNNLVAVIKCNGNILRERGGSTVYLPFGAEYSILIKNKDARRALVDIEVDGQNVFAGGRKLIVEGNATSEVKGWMRSMHKTNRFKFIQKTRQIQKHRGDRIDDGLVRVSYQFEKQEELPQVTWTYTSNDNDWSKFSRTKSSGATWGDWPVSYGSSTCDSDQMVGAVNCNYHTNTKSFAPRSDEGITAKGQHITNRYRYGNIGALESSVYTIVLQLKGRTKKQKVSKPLTVKSSLRCNICGRRAKSSAKYCSRCGNYLF